MPQPQDIDRDAAVSEPAPARLDSIEAKLYRIEVKIDLLIEILAEEEDQVTDLEGAPLPRERNQNELL